MTLDDGLHHHPAGEQIPVKNQPGGHLVVQIKAPGDQQPQPSPEQKPTFPFETGLTQKAFEGPVRHDTAV